MKSQRILGYDLARAIAIIGMIFVNFKTVMLSHSEEGFLYYIVDGLSGKAAALFVVLAGVGITIMYKAALAKNSQNGYMQVRNTLIKRAIFLFLFGLSYYFIWPADILHYYGIYILIALLFLKTKRNTLIWVSVFMTVVYMLMLFVFDYEKGWNWDTIEYENFFSIKGFMRNLFFNGFHPVIPWVAFLLTGLWVGRLDLQNKQNRKTTFKLAMIVFITTLLLSKLLIFLISYIIPVSSQELYYILGTSPMPPNIFYMLTGSSLAIVIICTCLWFSEKIRDTILLDSLVNTGQLALSIYFAHVVVGMLVIELVFGKLEQAFSMNFVFIYSAIFSIVSVLLSTLWKRYYKRGPLELIMRYITNLTWHEVRLRLFNILIPKIKL